MRAEPRPKLGMQQVTIGPVSVEIPADWDLVPLDEITLNNGQYGANASAEEYDPDKFRYVRISDISEEGNLENDEMRSIPIDGNEKYRLEEGDLLFARTGAVGRSYMYSETDSDVPCAFAGYLIRFKLSDEVCDEYINQFTNSRYFRKWVDSMARSTTHANINASEYASVEIPYPPLPEQHQIADILSTVDEKIQQTEEVISKTYSLREALMQDFFERGLKNCGTKELRLGAKKKEVPQHWEVRNLEEISTVKRGASPRPISDERYFGGDIGWVRISDITRSDKYLEQTSDYLSDEGVSESVLVQKGTVLLSISATIGKPAILQKDACIHDGIVAFRDLSKKVDPEYMYYSLLEMKERLKSQNQRAAGHQTNINSTVVKRSKILLPPIEEQRAIRDILGKVDEKIVYEKKEKRSLISLKRGLTQDLLTGKVRINADN